MAPQEDMVSILPPDASVTFILALVIPLVIGFLVGVVIKSALKIGAAIAIIVLLLIFVGALTPSQVIEPVMSLFRSGADLTLKVKQLAGYLPYSSVLFIIGLAIGFFK
jgi:uncharacterized protein YqfA (UPF0365 family)